MIWAKAILIGRQIPIPSDLFAKVTETISVYPTICDAPHRACLHAYRLPYEYKGSETFAVQGQGDCYCSWAGNCRFWIYRKHRSKYEKLFEADNVQAFTFLPARGNLPFSSSGLAIPPFVFPLAFCNLTMEYHDSDGWIEQYQYEDEDGRILRP